MNLCCARPETLRSSFCTGPADWFWKGSSRWVRPSLNAWRSHLCGRGRPPVSTLLWHLVRGLWVLRDRVFSPWCSSWSHFQQHLLCVGVKVFERQGNVRAHTPFPAPFLPGGSEPSQQEGESRLYDIFCPPTSSHRVGVAFPPGDCLLPSECVLSASWAPLSVGFRAMIWLSDRFPLSTYAEEGKPACGVCPSHTPECSPMSSMEHEEEGEALGQGLPLSLSSFRASRVCRCLW